MQTRSWLSDGLGTPSEASKAFAICSGVVVAPISTGYTLYQAWRGFGLETLFEDGQVLALLAFKN
jgi:hypothetical protein